MYSGELFTANFREFIERYGLRDMYSAGFYPFPTQEEKWGYWSRHIYYNRYDVAPGKPYLDLYALLKDKNYFILTTNVDHQFWLAGFPDERCCGVDVHKSFLVATIVKTTGGIEPSYQKKRFSTFNNSILEFKQWLLDNDCHDVCMESTGKYCAHIWCA